MAPIHTKEICTASTQDMADAGLNPFAVQLLVEWYAWSKNPPIMTFGWRGVEVSLRAYYGPLGTPIRNGNATTPEGDSGAIMETQG